MLYPRLWLKHWRTRRALVGYPLYDAPHKQAEHTLKEVQFQENYDYFMNNRLKRLAFFQAWLKRHFRVDASINGDGLRAANAWVNDYGGALIGDEPDTMTIFASYMPRWEGQYVGYNVLYDIAIFIGEYLIFKRPKLRWELYRGPKAGSGETVSINLYRPHIGGFTRYWEDDVLNVAYLAIVQSRNGSKIGHNPLTPKPQNPE